MGESCGAVRAGAVEGRHHPHAAGGAHQGRGLHSFTFRLNLSAACGTGGARRGYVDPVKAVFRVCRVFLCVRHGSS